MANEIERKFLVNGDFLTFTTRKTRVIQAYLSSQEERSVRIRISGDKGYITIKGTSHDKGLIRYEWEKEIPLDDAKALLRLCEPGQIDKYRYEVPEKSGLLFEVDVFRGENEGLVIAEIELPEPEYPFEKPDWLGPEVTGDEKYYNLSLAKHPYKSW
jgi:adenylate cyclase